MRVEYPPIKFANGNPMSLGKATPSTINNIRTTTNSVYHLSPLKSLAVFALPSDSMAFLRCKDLWSGDSANLEKPLIISGQE
jgi:hypothetical protein